MSNLNTEAYLRARGVIDNEPIDHDHPCPTCGYNLRGLKYGGKCPECGAVIERRRYQFEHFMDAPIEFMKWVRMGLGLMAVGYVILLGSIIMAFLASSPSTEILFVFFACAGGMLVAGLWIITKKRPDAPVHQSSCVSMRSVTRIFSIAVIILILFQIIITMQRVRLPVMVDWVLEMTTITAIYATGAFAAWFLSGYARWVHDDELARQFELIIVLLIVLWILILVIIVVGSFFYFLTELVILASLGTCVWYFINIAKLCDLVNRAVRDKPIHDSNILRDPEKILR